MMEGRPSELEAQTGAVTRLGRALGVRTPTHDFIYAALLPQERDARGLDR
jgi:2-dehydropantoate 2-reductase